MLSVYEVKLQDTRFYQEASAEGEQIGLQKGLQKGLQEECIKLVSRLYFKVKFCSNLFMT